MPENTKLAVLVVARFKRRNGLVYTDELMVLRYNLVGVFMIENEVFDVVQQSLFGQKSVQYALKTCAFFFNGFAVDLFGFIVGAQPTEKELIPGGETSHAGFHRVGKHAEGIVLK